MVQMVTVYCIIYCNNLNLDNRIMGAVFEIKQSINNCIIYLNKIDYADNKQ